ncbi:MAG: hypothetical protein IJV97_00760 [Alphaproteobacteria bacterium]|nr:hypothetical protein [Alphaproteobacteria bacterium]
MSESTTNYFSHKLEFNLNKKPAKVSDRTNWGFLLPQIVTGVLLVALGVLEMIGGFKYTNTNIEKISPLNNDVVAHSFFTPLFFDIVFILFGLSLIIIGVLSYLRYRKYIFDGKQMLIGYRPIFGKKRIIKEKIKNFLGVRFRIVFYQLGIRTTNKYIIELCHKDPNKNVPLYISVSPVLVRKKWKEYARFFKLPALINTDEGLISRNLKDLDLSLKKLAAKGVITDNFDSYDDLPESLKYVRRKDKIVLKRKNTWDIYNFMAWMAVIAVSSMTVLTVLNFKLFYQNMQISAYGIIFMETMFIALSLLILFRKEKLVLKKHKIVNTHKYMLFSTKHNEILKDDIEAIEVSHNPASGRYFVSIISDNNTITFGAKLPVNDLKWIKCFLIHEVIK